MGTGAHTLLPRRRSVPLAIIVGHLLQHPFIDRSLVFRHVGIEALPIYSLNQIEWFAGSWVAGENLPTLRPIIGHVVMQVIGTLIHELPYVTRRVLGTVRP